jgi:hypothetical protein
MAELFPRWSSGQPFVPTQLWLNLINEMGKDFLRRKRFQEAGPVKLDKKLSLLIKNVSGTALAFGSIVALGDADMVPRGTDTGHFGQTVFASAEPLAGSPFAILQEPAADEAIAIAVMSGLSYVKINLASTEHEYAIPLDTEYAYLISQSAAGPAQILWREGTMPTTLDGGIDDTETEIVVDSTEDFPDVPFLIRIGDEDLLVTAIDEDGVTLTVERGYGNTDGVAHDDEDEVTFVSGIVWALVMLVPRESPVAFVRADPLKVSTITTGMAAGSGVTITLGNAITGLAIGSKVHLNGSQDNGGDEVVTVLSTPTAVTFTADTTFDVTAGSRAALLDSTGKYMHGQKYVTNAAGILTLSDDAWIMTGSLNSRFVRSTSRTFTEIFSGISAGIHEGRELFLVQQTPRIVFHNVANNLKMAFGPDFSFGSSDDSIEFDNSEFSQSHIDFTINAVKGGTW